MAGTDGSGEGDDPGRRVDFVVGDEQPDDHLDDRQDEELEDESRARKRRLRIELGLGALVLLVVVLVSRAATDGGDPSPSSSGTPQVSYSLTPAPSPTGPVAAPPLPINGRLNLSLTPTATPTPTATVTFPKSLPRRTRDNPAACPNGHRCRTDVHVPDAVTAAVTTAIPESTITLVDTVRLAGAHPALWFRTITVRAGTEELVVQIQAPAKGDASGTFYRLSPSEGAITSYDGRLGPWHVRMRVLDPGGGQADPTVLARLANDPRLVAG